MKKILCLLLTLVLVFAFASCNKDKGDDTTNGDNNTNIDNSNDTNNDNNDTNNDANNDAVDPFEAFEKAIATSDASTVIVDVVTITALGELDSHYEIFFNDNGSAFITYTYERFYEIGEGPADEITYSTTKTIYRDADGNYSEDIGVDLTGVEPAVAFNVSALKGTVKINEIGDELNVTIPKTSTLELLGSQFSGDVQLKITLRDGALGKIVIASADRTITYSYQ